MASAQPGRHRGQVVGASTRTTLINRFPNGRVLVATFHEGTQLSVEELSEEGPGPPFAASMRPSVSPASVQILVRSSQS